jgi:hypothetical protein
MEVEGVRDWSWQGKNDPAFLHGAFKRGDVHASQIHMKMGGLFFNEVGAG